MAQLLGALRDRGAASDSLEGRQALGARVAPPPAQGAVVRGDRGERAEARRAVRAAQRLRSRPCALRGALGRPAARSRGVVALRRDGGARHGGRVERGDRDRALRGRAHAVPRRRARIRGAARIEARRRVLRAVHLPRAARRGRGGRAHGARGRGPRRPQGRRERSAQGAEGRGEAREDEAREGTEDEAHNDPYTARGRGSRAGDERRCWTLRRTTSSPRRR